MKFAFIIFSLFCSLAFAQNSSNTSVAYPTLSTDKFIRAGNYELGGGLAYTRYDADNSNFYISPDVSYFAWDNISLGLGLGYSSFKSGSSNFSSTFLGPKASWYFYESGPIAAFVSQRLFYSKSDSGSSSSVGQSSIGAKYFLNSSIAFGLDLNSSYGVGSNSNVSSSTSLAGSFSTFF